MDFYRTWVRSLVMLVRDSLPNSLTDCRLVNFSLIFVYPLSLTHSLTDWLAYSIACTLSTDGATETMCYSDFDVQSFLFLLKSHLWRNTWDGPILLITYFMGHSLHEHFIQKWNLRSCEGSAGCFIQSWTLGTSFRFYSDSKLCALDGDLKPPEEGFYLQFS